MATQYLLVEGEHPDAFESGGKYIAGALHLISWAHVRSGAEGVPVVERGRWTGETFVGTGVLVDAALVAADVQRERAVSVLAGVGLHALDLERLGLRRVAAPLSESRETDVRSLFEQLRHQIEATGPVWVEGTARGVRTSRGNALYFTLRDGDTSAHCRISSTMQRALYRPREGEQLRIRAVPTLFELRGKAQLDVLEVVSKEAV